MFEHTGKQQEREEIKPQSSLTPFPSSVGATAGGRGK